ncbi:hypothetical protein IG631_16854 [Alternaria alternata]|nr:hypothetical protein IG631_16854 [Alternaria alternata]
MYSAKHAGCVVCGGSSADSQPDGNRGAAWLSDAHHNLHNYARNQPPVQPRGRIHTFRPRLGFDKPQ